MSLEMNPEFYSLETICLDWTQRERTGDQGTLKDMFRAARKEWDDLVPVLFAIEDENNL